MIKEFIESHLMPASWEAKNFGYVHQSIALKERYIRNRLAWDSHVTKCHSWIKHAAQQSAKKNAVLVIGSGHLIEVPLHVLRAQFKKVYLLDMVHSKALRKLSDSSNGQVELLEEDVTGSIMHLASKDRWRPSDDWDFLKPWYPKVQADLVISANCLSQLPILPVQWLIKKSNSSLNEDQLHSYAQRIIDNHLYMLTQMTRDILLISDFQKHFVNPKGHLLSIEDSLMGIKAPSWQDTWMWNLAPIPEFSRNENMFLKVGAIFRGKI